MCTVIANSGASKKKGGETLLTSRIIIKPKCVLNCCDIHEADTLRVRSGDDPRGILKRIRKKKILKNQKLCGSAVGL